jgi:NDP-sugar pyrophosphorylase family protein
MIEHILLGARDAGVDHIAIVVSYLGDQIREALGDGSRLGLRLEYVEQGDPKGTGHAVLLCERFVGDEAFFLSWGDILVPARNYPKVVSAFVPGQTDAVLSVNWVEDPYEGAAVYVKDRWVERIEEKPPQGTATTHFNNAGLFVFTPELFGRLRQLRPSPRGEIELPDAVQAMIRDGAQIAAVELEGYWSDVARPSAVLALNEKIIQDRWSDRCGVYVDPSARVSEGAVLRPPVFIGPGCVVEQAKLGANVVLASDCVIKKGAQLKETALFAGARVGEQARLRYCLVEEGARLQEGGAVAGDRQHPLIVRSDGTLEQVPT